MAGAYGVGHLRQRPHRDVCASGPTTVAAFRANFVQLISNLGGRPGFSDTPNEAPNPVPFSEDHRDRPNDREAVQIASDPDEALMAFLVSTHDVAADLGGWDRDLLEHFQQKWEPVLRPKM